MQESRHILGSTCIPGGSFIYLEHVNFKVSPFYNFNFLASYPLGLGFIRITLFNLGFLEPDQP